MGFAELTTEKFRLRMRPHAETIYRSLWPGCAVEDLRAQGIDVHVLDQHFGIDTLVKLDSGQSLTLQEKYRQYKYLVTPRLQVKPGVPDFTQEYMNAVGTEHEAEGEWFHLAAQLYFYGWAAEDESRFEKWALLDIARYKQLVEDAGGLPAIGQLIPNRTHGCATFYAIPIDRLRLAWRATHPAKGSAAVARWYEGGVLQQP